MTKPNRLTRNERMILAFIRSSYPVPMSQLVQMSAGTFSFDELVYEVVHNLTRQGYVEFDKDDRITIPFTE